LISAFHVLDSLSEVVEEGALVGRADERAEVFNADIVDVGRDALDVELVGVDQVLLLD